MTANTNEMYVTDDGSFGDAFGLRTFTTTNWTSDEWAAFYEVSDNDRMEVAIEIDAQVWQRLNDETAPVELTDKGRHYLTAIDGGLSHRDALIYAQAKIDGKL